MGLTSSERVTIGGHGQLFHYSSPWRIATVATAGPESGRMIERRVRNGGAPSMRAASSRSRGIGCTNW